MATADDITDEAVEFVETEVGMGHGAWDMVDPKAIIAAVLNFPVSHQAAICEHGIAEGDWCEPCNREYKRAAREADNE